MGVNSLPKTVTRQSRSCDLNPGPTAPESSTLTTRLPSHDRQKEKICVFHAKGLVVDAFYCYDYSILLSSRLDFR